MTYAKKPYTKFTIPRDDSLPIPEPTSRYIYDKDGVAMYSYSVDFSEYL